MTQRPTGTATFLFTDIEGSTHLWQEKPEAMAIAHARHDEILREAIESNHGNVFQIVGDSFSAAFHNAVDGLRAVLAAQRGLQKETWGEMGAIKVRHLSFCQRKSNARLCSHYAYFQSFANSFSDL